MTLKNRVILYLAYPGGPIVITKVLYREKRQTSQNQSGVIVRKTLPAIAPLKMEERKGGREPRNSDTGKSKKTDSPIKLPWL